MKGAVQGLCAVGWGVAERLHAEGARLVVSDVRMDQVERAVERFGASVAPVDKIHEAEVDIYAPCALGGVITEATATEVRARAVEIGRASCGERVCQYVWISVVAVSLKKNKK